MINNQTYLYKAYEEYLGFMGLSFPPKGLQQFLNECDSKSLTSHINAPKEHQIFPIVSIFFDHFFEKHLADFMAESGKDIFEGMKYSQFLQMKGGIGIERLKLYPDFLSCYLDKKDQKKLKLITEFIVQLSDFILQQHNIRTNKRYKRKQRIGDSIMSISASSMPSELISDIFEKFEKKNLKKRDLIEIHCNRYCQYCFAVSEKYSYVVESKSNRTLFDKAKLLKLDKCKYDSLVISLNNNIDHFHEELLLTFSIGDSYFNSLSGNFCSIHKNRFSVGVIDGIPIKNRIGVERTFKKLGMTYLDFSDRSYIKFRENITGTKELSFEDKLEMYQSSRKMVYQEIINS